MWNNTDIPLAYLITFRSYGTWLHGDERGSVDRFHNQYLSPRVAPDPQRVDHNLGRLSGEIVTFDTEQRISIEALSARHASLRGGSCMPSTFERTMCMWSFQLRQQNPDER